VYAVSAIACAAVSTVSFLKIHGEGRALLVWIFGVLTIGCVVYACIGYRRGRG